MEQVSASGKACTSRNVEGQVDLSPQDELPISGARPPEVYYDYHHLDYSRLAPGGCTALRTFI